MPITASWDNDEQTIIRLEITGRWSFEEFEAVTTSARNMINQTPHQNTVGYLVVISREFYFPHDILSIARHGLITKNPRMVSIVIVSDHPVARALYGALKRLTQSLGSIVELVATEDAGRELVTRRIQERQHVSS